jgi:hypothetical protein
MILKKIRPRLQNSGMLFFVSYVMPCRNILIVRVFVKSPLSFHCKLCQMSRHVISRGFGWLVPVVREFKSSRR